jgi:hypothetical protein
MGFFLGHLSTAGDSVGRHLQLGSTENNFQSFDLMQVRVLDSEELLYGTHFNLNNYSHWD